jgi:hypothetical protein
MTRAHKSKAKAARTAADDEDALVARATDAPRLLGDGGESGAATPLVALLVISIVLLGLRLYAASLVGFGDSEALYATWAAHPQPAYLDHPGLVGVVASVIGEGAIPSPLRTHVITSFAATLVPWIAYATARALGAARGRAAVAGLVLAVVPETAVGLFALTPDLLLAIAWLGALLCAGIGLRATPGGTRSTTAFLGAGLLAGIACAAKVSGVLLVVALLAAYVSIARKAAKNGSADDVTDGHIERSAVRTVWPWAGILAGLVVVVPIALYEAKTGWSMLQHRFVDTQHGAGLALRNAGGLLGGQLAYLSPVFAFLALLAARDLVRERSRDAISRLLFFAFAIPILPLVALCLWSPVAEPHWIAPALLVLPLHVARRGGALASAALGSRRTFLIATTVAALFTLSAHAWVLIPESARLMPTEADAKLDIANELYGWPTAIGAVKEQMKGAGTPFDPEGREVVVVGPHWTVCAQLQAGLPGIHVGCATPVPDDFDRWLPREHWRKAEHVLFVTDNRFPGDGGEQLPAHVQTGRSRVRVLRAGKTARIFELVLYERRASTLR